MSEIEQLEEEKGIELIVRKGLEIDYTQTLKNLERYQNQQKLMMLESIDALIDNSINLYRLGEVTLNEVSKSYSNSVIAQQEYLNGRLGDQQKKFIEGYIRTEVEANKERLNLLKRRYGFWRGNKLLPLLWRTRIYKFIWKAKSWCIKRIYGKWPKWT